VYRGRRWVMFNRREKNIKGLIEMPSRGYMSKVQLLKVVINSPLDYDTFIFLLDYGWLERSDNGLKH